MKPVDWQKIHLVQTCAAYPEQYDAYYGAKRVGYLRMRNGVFRVNYPRCGGEVVFLDAEMEGDGEFSEDERDGSLEEARRAIAKRMDVERQERRR